VACAVAQEESWVGCAGEATRWLKSFTACWFRFSPKGIFVRERRRPARMTAEALTGPFFPLCHEQAESVLSCTLERFSAGNYGVMPFLRQPDFHGRARDDADAAAALVRADRTAKSVGLVAELRRRGRGRGSRLSSTRARSPLSLAGLRLSDLRSDWLLISVPAKRNLKSHGPGCLKGGTSRDIPESAPHEPLSLCDNISSASRACITRVLW
jgi:hypothetical protein